MKSIEEMLTDERKKFDGIKAPTELEATLSEALDRVPPKRKRNRPFFIKIAVAAIIFIMFTSYNYNALAYYSKKIIGFDAIIHNTLNDLNEADMGQVIDEHVELEDGTTFTVDGIMSDENQLVLFYTITNPDGVDSADFSNLTVTGFMTTSSRSHGSGMYNDNRTEYKAIDHFEPIKPFAKRLTLHLGIPAKETETIKFKHNPNEALMTHVKQSIKESITVNQGKMTFSSITASPTVTVISGTANFQNIPFEQIKLIANGEPIAWQGNRTSTGLKTTFSIRYDALPIDIESLQLLVEGAPQYDLLNKEVDLATYPIENFELTHGKSLAIKDIQHKEDRIQVTIMTDEDVTLDGVSIETKSGKVPLETTLDEKIIEFEKGKSFKERILLFETNEEPTSLHITGINYIVPYDKIIDIPVK